MNTTRRTLAIAAALLAVGAPLAVASVAQADEPAASSTSVTDTAEVVEVPAADTEIPADDTEAPADDTDPGTFVGMATPEYLDWYTPETLDAAQTDLVAFLQAKGLTAELVTEEDGSHRADYDPFVEANLDAVAEFFSAPPAS